MNITGIRVLCALITVLQLGCLERPDKYGVNQPMADTDAEDTGELLVIARRWVNGDEDSLYELESWEDAQKVLEYIAELEGVDPYASGSSLPECAADDGGEYAVSVWARFDDSAWEYTWEPKCAMDDRNNVCGTDSHQLVHLSMDTNFVLRDTYTVTSSNSLLRAWLIVREIFHDATDTNTRILTDHNQGTAAFCLPTTYDGANLSLGR